MAYHRVQYFCVTHITCNYRRRANFRVKNISIVKFSWDLFFMNGYPSKIFVCDT